MNALATIETLTAAVVFAPGGVEGIISKLETEVRATPCDMSTEKGRDAIKALAYKVARSKTALDEMGKELVAGIKKQAGTIDAERRIIRDRLDALRDEVRAPVTAWEETEDARIKEHESSLVWIIECPRFATSPTVAMIEAQLNDLAGLISRDWQEFKERADVAIAEASIALSSMHATALQVEADAAELAELRRLKAERDAADRLAEEARAKAARQAQEAEAAAECERLRAEQAKRDQEEAVARAIEQAEAKAKLELARAEQATRDAEAATAKAVEDERLRVAAAAAAEKAAADKREANKKHRAKIRNSICHAMIAEGLEAPYVEALFDAISNGRIPHVSITY